jgi:hypothetical protein
LCHQSIVVGQRRVQLEMRIAELEGQGGVSRVCHKPIERTQETQTIGGP